MSFRLCVLVCPAFAWPLRGLQLTIQKEAMASAILQQTFVAEYVVEDHMCDSCSRAAANPDQWVACVQVRQHRALGCSLLCSYA